MSRRRKVGLILAMAMLFLTGSLGVFNGLQALSLTLTSLQRSVSIGVLIYGIAGLAGGIALMARHSSAVWLAAIWGVAATYVSSLAAIAYAGADATLGGAIASGIGAALIAAGVIWAARLATRPRPSTEVPDGAPAATVVLLLLAGSAIFGGCRQLYGGPPVVTERGSDRMATKVVRAKREPDRLIAQDLTVCWVTPDLFAHIRPGDHWRCEWLVVPEGQ
jgi:hypothetical protein